MNAVFRPYVNIYSQEQQYYNKDDGRFYVKRNGQYVKIPTHLERMRALARERQN